MADTEREPPHHIGVPNEPHPVAPRLETVFSADPFTGLPMGPDDLLRDPYTGDVLRKPLWAKAARIIGCIGSDMRPEKTERREMQQAAFREMARLRPRIDEFTGLPLAGGEEPRDPYTGKPLRFPLSREMVLLLQSGERLTPEQRAGFREMARLRQEAGTPVVEPAESVSRAALAREGAAARSAGAGAPEEDADPFLAWLVPPPREPPPPPHTDDHYTGLPLKVPGQLLRDPYTGKLCRRVKHGELGAFLVSGQEITPEMQAEFREMARLRPRIDEFTGLPLAEGEEQCDPYTGEILTYPLSPKMLEWFNGDDPVTPEQQARFREMARLRRETKGL